MSNPSPSQNGKGSARRKENQSKIRENWDSIDWSKGRPQEKPAIERLKDLFENPPAGSRVLVEKYHDGQTAEWVPPKISEASFFLHYDPHLTAAENDLNEQMQEDDLRDY